MSRDSILQQIRARLGVAGDDESRSALVLSRLNRHAPNTIPVRARVSGEARIAAFIEMLERVHGTVDKVGYPSDVPAAVAEYLGGGEICLTREVDEMGLPWSRQPSLRLLPWSAKSSLDVCVSACVAAVAETGTVVVQSSAVTPLTQHFLGEKHIVILSVHRLYGGYEEIWPLVRERLPRHLTFVSGPSCTGDIEMVMEYGAHGPRNLHVIIVLDGELPA